MSPKQYMQYVKRISKKYAQSSIDYSWRGQQDADGQTEIEKRHENVEREFKFAMKNLILLSTLIPEGTIIVKGTIPRKKKRAPVTEKVDKCVSELVAAAQVRPSRSTGTLSTAELVRFNEATKQYKQMLEGLDIMIENSIQQMPKEIQDAINSLVGIDRRTANSNDLQR